MMNKMRESTGSILWILVFAFGGLWVIQDTGCNPQSFGGDPTAVAVVNGESISFEEYNRAIDQAVTNYQQRTGEAPSPQVLESISESVYQQLVEAKLREQEMQRLGITVSDSEIYDMVLGPSPDPFVLQQFGDGSGQVNRALLQSLIDNPEARVEWIQYEEFLRNLRRQQKLDNVIASGVRVSEEDVREEYRRINTLLSVEYVALPYSQISDSAVTVGDRDLRRYYNDHRDEYEQEKTFTFTYASLSKQAARRDSTALLASFRALRDTFATANDSLFLLDQVSEAPFVDTYHSFSDLSPAVAAKLFQNPQRGAIIGPFVAEDEVHLIKIRDVRPSDDVAVHARHILRRATTDEEKAAARDTLQMIRTRIQQGATFEEMAEEFGEDGTSATGGSLGWFTRGQMVETFETAAFDAPVGQVVGPIETEFGLHLIKVEDRAEVEVQISDLMRSLNPDVAMLNELEQKAEDIKYYAEESGDLAAEAERQGVAVRQASLQDEQAFIPGLGQSRRILNFLQGAKKGRISDVIELDNEFVIVRLDEVTPAGHRPFEDVETEIRQKVLTQKKREMQVQKLQQAVQQHGFDGAAQALGVQKQTQPNLSFNAVVIAGLGREPKFVGTAFGLNEGQTSGVVGGDNAAYVLKVMSVEAPDVANIPQGQKDQIRQQIESRRRSILLSRWMQTLRDEADIRDNRRRLNL